MTDPRHSTLTGADLHDPGDHASQHTDGTDDIQSATGSVKGLATAAQITKLNGITVGATDDSTVAAHIGDASDAHDASAISFVPVGTVAATDVQTAIAEVASEAGGGGGWTAVDASESVKGIAELATQAETNTGTDDARIVTPLKLKTNVDLHINDTTDAHDASAISILDSANQYTATNAEDALAEVLDALQAHEADTSAAHAASAVSFSPTGTIAATDVQAAIAEVASEASGGSSYRTLVTLGSDATNSTTTFADVTGLSFAVSSGTTYRFYFLIMFDSQAQTTGSKWSLNGPSTTALHYRVMYASGVSANTIANNDTYNSGTVSTASSGTTGNIATIEGIVIPSASGTLIARFASEAPGTNNQITAKAGSTVEYW